MLSILTFLLFIIRWGIYLIILAWIARFIRKFLNLVRRTVNRILYGKPKQTNTKSS